LGAFAFRAFARALAWAAFFGLTGPSVGRGIGLVCGLECSGRCSRVDRRPRGGASVARRWAAASRGLRGLCWRSSLARTGSRRFAITNLPF
jgi:hypothetical protein